MLRLVALSVDLSHLLDNILLLVGRKHVGDLEITGAAFKMLSKRNKNKECHLAGVQEIVDVFKERLLLDLCVRKKKGSVLLAFG